MNSKENHYAVSKECQHFLDQIKADFQNIASKTKLIFVKYVISEAISSPTNIDFICSTSQERSSFMTLLLEDDFIRDIEMIRISLDDIQI